MKLHEQRALQTHRHAMFALDVSQINWRTTVAHLPTEDSRHRPDLTLLLSVKYLARSGQAGQRLRSPASS